MVSPSTPNTPVPPVTILLLVISLMPHLIDAWVAAYVSSAMVPVPTAHPVSPHCLRHLLDIEGSKLTLLIAPPHYAATAIGSPPASALVSLAHAALFSPPLSTLEQALLNGYLVNFPGFTLATLCKHPPYSFATIKEGHLDQTRQNLRSTRLSPTSIETGSSTIPTSTIDADFHPKGIETITNMCFASIIAPTGQIYTDQTGKFILPSSTGNNYIMILYDYDSNFIFIQPFHNRTASCLLAAYQKLHQRLCQAGLLPKLQRLDYECSTLLKDFLDAEDIDFQLVPPAVHRRNAAERAIRTFQNQFIAGLLGVDRDFPLHL
jgi:hypothetical protein